MDMNEDLKKLSEEEVKHRLITPAIENAGWAKNQIRMEYKFTDGRVSIIGKKRGERKFADYALFYRNNIPLAVVEAKDNKVPIAHGLQQAIEYGKKLDIPFIYASNGDGFAEFDTTTGKTTLLTLEQFPNPTDLWQRYVNAKNLDTQQEKVILQPYYFADTSKSPRYYQRIAINRTIEAVSKGQNRILLVMATGTGKTYTVFQIIYRLWKAGVKRKVLYLADRNILVDQTRTNDFKPFQGVMTKIENRNMDSSYEIYLSLYHQLSSSVIEIFRQFSPDFFDLVIVDECHRSSADEASRWHEILSYYSNSTQIGLTATPKETEDISNISYFGEPIYTYSLKQGIDDGFLAPYKLYRVGLNVDLEGYRPEAGKTDVDGEIIEDKEFVQRDFDRTIVIDERTKEVAKNISDYLKKTDRFAKSIVFCVDTEHALRMRIALANENADLVQEEPNYVMRITGNDFDGKMQLDNFIDVNAKYPVIATTSRLLSTGVDAQTCKLIVLDREIGSMIEFKQIIGRGTRIREDKGKLHFTIMDFRSNYKKFSDPAFDGDPEVIYEDPTGKPNNEPDDVEVSEEARSGGDGHIPTQKIYVQGVEVSVINETVQFYDGDGKLVNESIFEYSKRNLKRIYPDFATFAKQWINSSKSEIKEKLENEGVFIDHIKNRLEEDIDEYDLIGNLGFDLQPMTREERVKKILQLGFLSQFSQPKSQIIKKLLDKYVEYGVFEFEDLRLLETREFIEFGGTFEIVQLFGGRANYLAILNDIEERLYA